jgi:hypothetical protein
VLCSLLICDRERGGGEALREDVYLSLGASWPEQLRGSGGLETQRPARVRKDGVVDTVRQTSGQLGGLGSTWPGVCAAYEYC